MSGWGYGPFDSERATDWAYEMEALMSDRLIETFTEYLRGTEEEMADNEEVIAGAFLMYATSINTPIMFNDLVFKLAIASVERAFEDDYWIDNFDDPKKKRQKVLALLTWLKRNRWAICFDGGEVTEEEVVEAVKPVKTKVSPAAPTAILSRGTVILDRRTLPEEEEGFELI
jgi:hypothetical protein